MTDFARRRAAEREIDAALGAAPHIFAQRPKLADLQRDIERAVEREITSGMDPLQKAVLTNQTQPSQTTVIEEIEKIMARVREAPPTVWCYCVSSKVPTVKRQWRSDGRLIVWLPRFFYDRLPRVDYDRGVSFAGVPGASYGTPVEILD